jgi:hypothetical protein
MKLRALANADFSEAQGPRGMAFTPGASTASSLPRRAQPELPAYQASVAPLSGAGVDLTAQFRLSADRRQMDLVMQPVFQTVNAGRPPVNLSVIPGGSNP